MAAAKLPSSVGSHAVAVSPAGGRMAADGRRLVSGSDDTTLLVWLLGD
jgi:hypothetical protein